MSDDDRDNLLEDIILLYNNFKKEYDEFIKQNKEILKSDNIQKTKDTLANKNSQKKTAENSIEQSILDLFEQYENLAIKLKESEKIIIKKSIKGGASKKKYLEDIKQELEKYEKTITDKDKEKIKSLKAKIIAMQVKINQITYYDNCITFLKATIEAAQRAVTAAQGAVTAAKDAVPADPAVPAYLAAVAKVKEAKKKANKLERSEPVIDKLLKALAKIKELQSKIKDQQDNKNKEDIFIQLNIELTKSKLNIHTIRNVFC